MIFRTKDFYGDLIEEKDLNQILEVYNSNAHFLVKHMDRDKVTNKWLQQEVESMKNH